MEFQTITIKEYLTRKGIPFREANGELITRCIFNNCDADSRGREAHLYFNAKTGQYECKKCGEKGNLITLAKHFGDSMNDIALHPRTPGVSSKRGNAKINPALVEQYHQALPEHIRHYLHQRGITDTLITDYKVGFGEFYGKRWITIPIKDTDGNFIFLKLRQEPSAGNEKMTYPGGIEAQIYDWEMLQGATEQIVLCEGELDRLLLLSRGIAAVTSTHGVATFKEAWLKRFAHLKRVYVCFDNDEAGRRGMERAIKMLLEIDGLHAFKIILPQEVGDGGDVTDYFVKLNGDPDDLFSKYAKDAVKRRVVITCIQDIQPEPISWLWPGRIALGKLTLVAGDPGLGKSLLTATLAASVSRGYRWPLGSSVAPLGDVVLLSAEDDPADTIRPRLDALEADCRRIHVLRAVQNVGAEGSQTQHMFSFKRDLVALEELLRSLPTCRLLVIDPVSAYLDGTDSHNNADLRGLFAPLAELAAQHKVAVVLIQHLNKSNVGSALYRPMGSLAFIAAARAAYIVTKDKNNPDRRLLMPAKNNLAKDTTGLAYSVVTAENGAPTIVWESEPVTITADEALAIPELDGERTATEEAADFLCGMLSNGPVGVSVVQKEARQAGISEKPLRRARERLGIKTKKSDFAGGWVWSLAEDAQCNKDAHLNKGASWEERASSESRLLS